MIPDNVSGMDAELKRMEAEVLAVDAGAPEVLEAGKQAEQQIIGEQNEVEELKALLQIVSGLFVPFVPAMADIYTPEECERLAAVAVPVMQKHGWSTGGLLGQYAAELALLAVAAPMGLNTYFAIKAAMTPKEKTKANELPEVASLADVIPLPDASEIGAMGLARG